MKTLKEKLPQDEVDSNWTVFQADGNHIVVVKEMKDLYRGTLSYNHSIRTFTTNDWEGAQKHKSKLLSAQAGRFVFAWKATEALLTNLEIIIWLREVLIINVLHYDLIGDIATTGGKIHSSPNMTSPVLLFWHSLGSKDSGSPPGELLGLPWQPSCISPKLTPSARPLIFMKTNPSKCLGTKGRRSTGRIPICFIGARPPGSNQAANS